MKKLLICFLLLIVYPSIGQSKFHYLVHFKWKKSLYSFDVPADYLSPKSIQRKADYGLGIDSTDLPINPDYLTILKNENLEIEAKSKWNNCIVISSQDEAINNSILSHDFVKSCELIGERASNKKENDKLNYGNNESQILSLSLNKAHNKEFTGKGVDLAIIDAGFKNFNTISFFDSVFNNAQIISTYDFVRNQPVSYSGHSHGTEVASLIVANSEESYVGTAPSVKLHLLVSEDINQENLIEEFHMIEALEYCDSVGVEVINISLGYSTFDDSNYSHSPSSFTGDSLILNKSCNIAWKKGAFIVTSAGNAGTSNWGVVTTPANADSVLTVGGVDSDLNYASFSSRGNPHYLNSQKPNVSGIGKGTVLVKSNGALNQTNGTSYSSPQIAGFVACLYEAFPSKKNWEIKKAVELSSSHYYQPDSLIGFGIPNYEKASIYLEHAFLSAEESNVKVYPNPTCGSISIINNNVISELIVFDLKGDIVFQNEYYDKIVFEDFSFLSSGVYLVKVLDEKGGGLVKFLKI